MCKDCPKAEGIEITPEMIEAGVEYLDRQLEGAGYAMPRLALETWVEQLARIVRGEEDRGE